MQDPAGRILVMDFGLARTLEGDGMTQTGAIVGTMEYMSPNRLWPKIWINAPTSLRSV